MFADGQAEPRAAILPGVRSVHLAELFKEQSDLLRRNPDTGVAHGHSHPRSCGVLAGAIDGDENMAAGRELDGIADKIEDHLANARTVSQESSRRLSGIFEKEVDFLIAGHRRQ